MINQFTNFFYNSVTNEYTIFGTITYSILLILGVYLIYTKIIQRSKIKIDKKFVLSTIPFIILGGLARAKADILLHPSFPLSVPDFIKFFIVTPGIYFTLVFFTLGILFLSIFLEKKYKISYNKTMIYTGSTLSVIIALWLFQFISNFKGMLITLVILSLFAIVLYPLTKKFSKYLTKENYYILLSHLFDASATFTALQFHTGLGEKHVLPNFLIFDAALGPWIMFALKLGVVWPVLYYIDKSSSDKEYKTWLKIFIIILGLSLGVRDIFSIGIFGQSLI